MKIQTPSLPERRINIFILFNLLFRHCARGMSLSPEPDEASSGRVLPVRSPAMFQILVFLRPCSLQARTFLAKRGLGHSTGKWLAVAALSAALPIAAHAGRPMVTDDAGVMDAGACQLEAWTERARDGNTTWLNPGCNPFGATEFSLGAGRQRLDTEDGTQTGMLYSWQVKHLLREADDERIGFAVSTGGQHSRASGDNEIFIKGIATAPLMGDDLLAHINLGAVRQREDQQRHYRGAWGLALDAAVLPATRASLEAFGTSGTTSSGADRNWQLGLRHELIPGRLQLDTSIGSPFGRWQEGRVFSVGLVFTTPAFLR